jgi:hypothetical protein
MSYSLAQSILTQAGEDTLLQEVIVTERYGKITDTQKHKYPYMWANITESNPVTGENGVNRVTYTVNLNLFYGENDNKSKGSIDAEKLNESNTLIDSIFGKYINNLYYSEDVDEFEFPTATTNVPLQNNGANVWGGSVSITILNDITCSDEC